MEKEVPISLRSLLQVYLQALKPWYAHFYGVYVHGSIALDAFEEAKSDIDILVLTQGEWPVGELRQFEAVHRQLLQTHPLSVYLDVVYIPLQEQNTGRMPLVAIFRDGKFSLSRTSARTDATMRWIIRYQGISLLGPEPSALPLEVEWKDVLAAMRFNLDNYWSGKARRPYLFLSDYWVMTATATLCRILTTIEEGEIIAKSLALRRWRDHLPSRWQTLLDEAWRIRHHADKSSLYNNRIQRMRETLAFIRYVRARGKEALDGSSI